MALRTEQIVKILQLKKLGRRTAYKVYEVAKKEVLDDDRDLIEFIGYCKSNNLIKNLQDYSNDDFQIAFDKAEKIFEKSDKENIKIVSVDENLFPESLRKIKDPPIILNYKGDIKQINNTIGVAIIGTRKATKEGVISGEFFGRVFGKTGFNVVSGLALGCDAAAHRGCVQVNGFTTAILAHGLHTVYPKDNRELAEKILSNDGVLLSEYFAGAGALSNYFVERDRLQAGLAVATIVIQTAIKGGTMHAVNATIESNKILAAVDYRQSLISEMIAGNRMLINYKDAFRLTSINYSDLIRKIQNLSSLKYDLNIPEDLDMVAEPKADEISKQYKLDF